MMDMVIFAVGMKDRSTNLFMENSEYSPILHPYPIINESTRWIKTP
jgi:hypothetical protein